MASAMGSALRGRPWPPAVPRSPYRATNSPSTAIPLPPTARRPGSPWRTNYFHDNDLVQWQACVDTHPQGGYAIRAVVRDNIFERTRPMAFKSGSLEITGNYFDPGCGDYSVGGYSRMLDFGDPTHNGNHIAEAVLHNIYIGDNVERHGSVAPAAVGGRLRLRGGDEVRGLQPVRRRPALQVQQRPELCARHPFPDSSPSPFVGHMYVTLPGAEERVDTLETNTWYDLHALAVDPQGANDIAEIGVQLISSGRLASATGDRIALKEFSAGDSYFIRGASGSVYSREEEGSADWTDLTGSRACTSTAQRRPGEPTAATAFTSQRDSGCRIRPSGEGGACSGMPATRTAICPSHPGTSCWRAGP